jgi:prephenate dehydratase
MFYIDVEIPQEITLFRSVLDELKAYTDNLRLLGMYEV